MFGGVFKKPKALFARSQSRVGAASPRSRCAVVIVAVVSFRVHPIVSSWFSGSCLFVFSASGGPDL